MAKEYFNNVLTLDIDKRIAEGEYQYTKEQASKNKIAGAVKNIGASAMQGTGYIGEALTAVADIANGTQTPVNPYGPNFAPARTVQATEEGITRDMGAKGKGITDAALSAGQSLINMPFGQAGLINMSAGAAAQGVYEKEMQGSDRGKAVAYGTAAGVIEYATEKMPFENAAKMFKNVGKTTATKLIKDMIINAGVEASEESVSNVAGNIADIWIYGDNSEYEGYRQNLIANGVSEGEASKEALKKFFVSDTVQAAAGGALSAVMLGGAAVGANAAANINETAQLGRDIKDEGNVQKVINDGLRRDNKTKAYRLADKLQKGQKRQSNYNVGRAATETVNAMADEDAFRDSLSRNTGIENEVHDTLGDENGRYSNGKVDIARDGDTSIPRTAKHEYLHAFREYAPRAYREFQSRLFEFAKATNEEAFNEAYNRIEEKYRRYYEEKGLEYNSDIAEEELAADLTGEFLPNGAEDVEKVVRKNPQEVNRFIRSIEDAKAKIQDKLRTPFVDDRTGLQLTYSQLNELGRLYNTALYETAQNYKNGTAAESSGEMRYSPIMQNSKGKYVQADRQVITSQDPNDWEDQIYDYINAKIRNGQDVVIPTDDGDNLTITEKTAWKMGYRNRVNDNGITRPYNNTEYRTKLNAAAHIDELAEISKRGKNNVPDKKNHDFAQSGFNYRTAYFRDLDGRYYRLTISVGENPAGKIVYNIGDIKKVSFPDNGSKTNSNNTARSKQNLTNNISNSAENVKYSLKNEDGSNKATAKHYSKQLISEYGSKVNSEETVDDLDAAFHALLGGTTNENMTEAIKRFTSAAEKIADNIVITHDDLYETYKDLRKTIKGTAISIANRDKASITGADSFGEFRKQHLGSLNITNSGIPIDSFYQELAEQYPNFFPTDITHPAEQLTRLTEVLDSLKPQEQRLSTDERTEAKEEIVHKLFNTVGAAADSYSKKTTGRSIFDTENLQSDNSQTHTPEQLKVMQEYEDAVDEHLIKYIDEVKKQKTKWYYKISKVSDRAVSDIKSKLGIDVSNAINTIDKNTIEHIEDYHGVNGKRNHSMADVKDIARIGYVLDNYDTMTVSDDTDRRFKNKDNSPAKKVVFEKRIDGTYYVVEAVPDTGRLSVVTAYIKKASEVSDVQTKNPGQTPANELPNNASADNISDPEKDVKSKNQPIHITERNGQVRVLTPAEAARATADPAKLEQKFKEEYGEGFRDAYNDQSVSRVDKEKLGKD